MQGVFVLSGSSVGPGASEEDAAAVMDLVSVPVAYVVGGPEDIATDQAHQDYRLLGNGIAGYLAQRAEGDHLEVSTNTGIVDEAAEIGLHWLDLIFHGTATPADALAEHPCPSCDADLWTIGAKHLDSLVD